MFVSRLISKSISPLALRFTGTQVVPVAKSIPANLKLADEKILEEAVAPIVPEIDMFFPRHPNSIPSSAKVVCFGKKDTFTDEPIELNKQIFGVAYRSDIVNSVVKYLRHKRRQPKMSKRVSDISGSNAKPHPQKRQGRAQAGKKRNSVWRHGQKAHGPVLRDYSINMPKKVRALGLMIVLASKLREGNLIIVDNLHLQVSSNIIHIINIY